MSFCWLDGTKLRLDVYWDGVYGSFAFVLRDLVPSEQLLTKEHVQSSAIAESFASEGFPFVPMAYYYYGGQRLPGILDRNGDLRFYGRPINNAPTGILQVTGKKAYVVKGSK